METSDRFYLYCRYPDTGADYTEEELDGMIEVACWTEETARETARRIIKKFGTPTGHIYIEVWQCEWVERGWYWRKMKLIDKINLDLEYIE